MNQQIHDALKELEQENENEVTTAHGRRVSYSHVRSHADQEAALTVLEYGGMRA